ncbi:hypothetical protein HOLleu_03728 [Holothuria leucospilota]|uniref:DUF4371 domain-containing protein n=1 Tax=Holothuria leucospilota TaxID=206669 RepID=A0A9Q1CSD2_HOLLE|nr:hypothetical protein HOLleu_03728 [Holothuria leucospilota]
MFRTIALLERKHGVDVGHSYLHDKACREFIGEISWCFLQDLKKNFERKPFYCSILFDGSTDKTLSEKEIVSIKIIDQEGKPTTKLLGIAEPTSGRAESIYEALKVKAEEVSLFLTKSCVAMAADGASVNFGSQSGVMVRMKEDMPWMLQFHCVAHRLELAIKDAFKDTYFIKVSAIVKLI